MSVPIVYKIWRKAPLRQAVKDVVEVCSHARARAIMQGATTEVDIYPKENRLALGGGASPPRSAGNGGAAPEINAPAASGSGLSAQLSDRIIIETLDINMSGVEFNDAEIGEDSLLSEWHLRRNEDDSVRRPRSVWDRAGDNDRSGERRA